MVQTSLQHLHDQDREVGSGGRSSVQETDPQEEDHVGVTQTGEKLTLVKVFLNHAVGPFVLGVDESVVHSLAGTNEAVDPELLHTAVGALPQCSSSLGHSSQEKWLQTSGCLQCSASVGG